MLPSEIPEHVKAACAKGAALLDEKHPDWFKAIYYPLLMAHTFECVLGQLYDDYFKGAVVLFGKEYTDEELVAHGFMTGSDPTLPTWFWQLHPCWIHEISSRRGTIDDTLPSRPEGITDEDCRRSTDARG